MNGAPSSRALAGHRPRSRVVVVLSSYNGGRYLAPQLESLLAQTYREWTLLVRDDGSTDDTVSIIEAFAARDPRIGLVRDARGNLGPAASFGVLLERALAEGAQYVALADQDDVWHETKLARQLERLWSREAEIGVEVPLLVHSDLTIVREDLDVVHESFLASQGLDQDRGASLPVLLVQNFVTGCTVVGNAALLRAAVPLPPQVIMHDWWLALVAAAGGEVLFLPAATLLYRQHGANAVGWRGVREACAALVRRPLSWWRQSGALAAAALTQAYALYRRIESRAVPARPMARVLLREYCAAFADGRGAWHRLRTVRRYRILPRTLIPFPLFYYVRVLLFPGHPPASEAGRA